MPTASRIGKRLSTEQAHGRFDRVLRDLMYQVGDYYYCAHEGDLIDYSSTPTFYDLIVKTYRVRMAGAIHDPLYKYGVDCNGRTITRAEADMVWREVAQIGEDSANAFQAWLGWAGLRALGWIAWNEYRRIGDVLD